MIWALWLACGAADGGYPCATTGDPALEVAPSGVDYPDFADGEALPYGNPPQGGAPYAPIHVRLSGLDDLDEGVHLAATIDDVDGTALGGADLDTRLVCANVGDSAGKWTGADVHLRFPGWSLDDLADREVRVDVIATDLDGDVVEGGFAAVLSRM